MLKGMNDVHRNWWSGGLQKVVKGITYVVGQMLRGFVVESRQRCGISSDVTEANPICLNIGTLPLPFCPLPLMPRWCHCRSCTAWFCIPDRCLASVVQNTVLFALIICVLQYLEKTGQLKIKAVGFLQTGSLDLLDHFFILSSQWCCSIIKWFLLEE